MSYQPLEPTSTTSVSDIKVGIIGAGDMGKLYANKISEAGIKVNICDLPRNYENLKQYYKDTEVEVVKDGYAVSRQSDIIFYSIEAENLLKAVELYGPATKIGAIVAGQTSVKAPEIEAFENFLPNDCQILTCHSMHGPTVDTVGQPLAVIEHRNDARAKELILQVLNPLKSKLIFLNAIEHDRITANTQAVTHLAFISMGTAWRIRDYFPWEQGGYIGGIENVKVNTMLRIFSNKWHVYAGLAILNPSARKQIEQFATSTRELFELMLQEDSQKFIDRIFEAGKFVFKQRFNLDQIPEDNLLSTTMLDQFSLNKSTHPSRPNSHLSLLAIVDCWFKLGIQPYDHIVCQTPPFRLWLGIVESLFTSSYQLNAAIHTALYDKTIRLDDLNFFSAVQSWSQIVLHQAMPSYRKEFELNQTYFKDYLQDGKLLSTKMVDKILLDAK